MRLPRRRSPLERLGAVQRYADRHADDEQPLAALIDDLRERVAEAARRLDDLERRLQG